MHTGHLHIYRQCGKFPFSSEGNIFSLFCGISTKHLVIHTSYIGNRYNKNKGLSWGYMYIHVSHTQLVIQSIVFNTSQVHQTGSLVESQPFCEPN